MNWHDGLALIWHWIVVGSTLGEPQIKHSFCYFWLWHEGEGLT